LLFGKEDFLKHDRKQYTTAQAGAAGCFGRPAVLQYKLDTVAASSADRFSGHHEKLKLMLTNCVTFGVEPSRSTSTFHITLHKVYYNQSVIYVGHLSGRHHPQLA